MATLLCVHGNLSALLPGYGHVAGSWSVMEAEGMVLQAGPEKSPTIDPSSSLWLEGKDAQALRQWSANYSPL